MRHTLKLAVLTAALLTEPVRADTTAPPDVVDAVLISTAPTPMQLALAQAEPAPPASGIAGAFWAYMFPLLASALGSLALWALKKLADFLASRSESSKWYLLGAKLTTLVEHAVADAEVTLRPKFAKAMEDGKLSPEEGAALKAEVIALVKRQAPEVIEGVKWAFGDALDTVLGGAVERAVAALPSSVPVSLASLQTATASPQ